MHPSTQVTHIPEAGTTDPSVRFLVSVAADELTFESEANMAISLSGKRPQSFLISQATQGSM
jgi:hypothetical protein